MAGPRVGRAEAVAARLLRLEARLARAERQLRAALALRGRLQALERRLESGGGGGAPRMSARRGAAGGGRLAARPQAPPVPVNLEDVWVHFSEREWRALRGWQRALHRAVMRSNYHMLLSFGKGPAPPSTSRRACGEGSEREVGRRRVPAVPMQAGPPAVPHLLPPAEADAPRRDGQARSEDGNQPCARSCEDGDGRGDAAETGTEDSIIHIKQEEELCTADQQEGEAGETPEEPCPAEGAFYEPEASSQTKKGKEAYARELPGAEGEDLPRHPDTGFQTYATDVLSWIKQEEEPRCPEQQDLEKEEISTNPSTVHDDNTTGDPPADCFESTVCDSEVPGRPGEKFYKDPSPGVTQDGQWNSEMMETNTTGNSIGGDARYDREFGEHLDFFSTQENSVGKRPCVYNKCERNSSQQEHLQTPQGAREEEMFPGPACEKSLSERVFHLLHSQPCALGENGIRQGTAPASCEGLPAGPQLVARTERGQNPAGGTRLRDHSGLGGEEQPSAESEENFPAENSLASPCWDHPQDKSEACTRCRQHFAPRGSPASQQQSQGRGKSYICSDCGKSFVCHSWLVRHQMTHTGERPYKCSECDKSYRRKDYLLNHQRRHSGEGLFQCPLCRKRACGSHRQRRRGNSRLLFGLGQGSSLGSACPPGGGGSERAPIPRLGTCGASPVLRGSAPRFPPPPSGSRRPSRHQSSVRRPRACGPSSCGRPDTGLRRRAPLAGSRPVRLPAPRLTAPLSRPGPAAAGSASGPAPLPRCYDNEKARARNPGLPSREVTLASSNQRPVSSCAGQWE
ncbi:hypothetical protein QYF61_001515 [Mycteria americana]|uniref:Uncharacterized protein n=1 Tax=Mycteria americana TaxID=33587 RepID=A0AAN7S266_MYCAM|nr:hypothetical protein QYF61_001515 [Mycteria americana]